VCARGDAMDEPTRLFLWVLAAGGFGAVLGAGFGALTGALSWAKGNATGTAVGLGVARAFDRAAGGEMSPARKGALVGGADGLVFLGVLGTAVGYLLAARGRPAWATFRPAMTAALLLTGGAALFGLLGYGLLSAGVRAVAGLFAGAMLGALVGLYLGQLDGLVLGAVAGAFLGTVTVLFWGW
jgi:hypothetical protein